MEEGEEEMMDMEEGEEEADEFVSAADEDEFVSDDEGAEGDEKMPKAIPIRKDTVGISHATK
mgnify:CR=1 FL=1